MSIICDIMSLDDGTRDLIRNACGGSKLVRLKEMDKGASGAKLWLAQWQVNKNQWSKFHVFKIHNSKKIDLEYTQIKDVASVLEKEFPSYQIFDSDKTTKKLLRYQFFGADCRTRSLREFIQNCKSIPTVEQIIHKLYHKRLAAWHPMYSKKDTCSHKMKLNQALEWWLKRMDLDTSADEIGRASLEESLKRKLGMNLYKMKKEIKKISEREEMVNLGTVHGDLHTQNVLVDDSHRIELIDYGWASRETWKAVDFLMMECSLKFAVTPPNAVLNHLISLDALLDLGYDGSSTKYYKELEPYLYGKELEKVARAIHIVRKEAIKRKAAEDIVQYKRGLALMTAGLANVKQVVNRVYIFHSLAYQLKSLHPVTLVGKKPR